MDDLIYTLKILWHNFLVRLAEAGAWLIVLLFFTGCSFSLVAVWMVSGDFKESLEIFNTWVQNTLSWGVGVGGTILFGVLVLLYLRARAREHHARMGASRYSVARDVRNEVYYLSAREQEQFSDPDFIRNQGG